MVSSIYVKPVEGTATPIQPDTNIFVDDVEIGPNEARNGGGAILRLYFTFDAGNIMKVGVFINGSFTGLLNADNGSDIQPAGMYRFDIGVEAGDTINIQTSSTSAQITNIPYLRAHLVEFGA